MPETHRFLVLDQNVLRDRNALESALDRCCREDLGLLITDNSAFEWSKGSKPFDTWRRSLEILSVYPEFVSVSRRLTDLLDDERLSAYPCNVVVHDGLTTSFRKILHELRVADYTSLQAILDGPARTLLPESLLEWGNHVQHKQWIVFVRDELRNMVSEKKLKSLRRDPQAGLVQWLSSEDGLRFVFQGIKQEMKDDVAALRLTQRTSALGAFVSTFGAIGMYWLLQGGLDTAPPQTITNDFQDIEYAVVGSLCQDLVTKDKRLATIYHAVTRAVPFRHRWVTQRLNPANLARL